MTSPMYALEAQHVVKAFGTRRAVDDVSFALPEGAFLSIFGPNGAGKTTLLRVLATLARPSSGTVAVGGVDAREQPDAVRARIGFVSHAPMLYPDLTAQENLEFYARLYGVPDPAARARELLDAVGLAHRRLDAVRTFSRGMAQRTSIARALVHDPDVVFLDEPYSGLDPHAVEILDQIIQDVRGGRVAGRAEAPAMPAVRTSAMVSHDLQKGYQMCTHALVLARGRMVAFAPKEELDFQDFAQLYAETVGTGVA